MTRQSFGIGLIGAGNFGRFCLKVFQKLPNLNLTAICNMDGAELLAEKLAPREKLLAMPGEPFLPESNLSCRILERYPSGRIMKGHGEERRIDARVAVQANLGGPDARAMVYEHSVRAGLAALLSAVENGQSWVISPAEQRESTATAITAGEAATSGQVVFL